MESTFITELNIHHVRHLKNIVIPLSKERRKNLILTGKNGSGKTSILNALVSHLSYIIGDHISKDECIKQISIYTEKLAADPKTESDHQRKLKYQKQLKFYQDTLMFWTSGATFEYTSLSALKEKYQEGNFILAYFRDNREIEVEDSKNIEKITLKPFYSIKDKPSRDLSKYLVNLKTTQAFAQAKKDSNRVAEIDKWFQKFENILKKIYNDISLCLDFDIDSFKFSINMNNRDPFDFNTMSTGYAAVFDIIGDLIMRMESKRNYNLEGIVLIDEIETHLHVELQKEILPPFSQVSFPICSLFVPLTLHSFSALLKIQPCMIWKSISSLKTD